MYYLPSLVSENDVLRAIYRILIDLRQLAAVETKTDTRETPRVSAKSLKSTETVLENTSPQPREIH